MLNKKAEFYSLLNCHNPDIVIGTESWLTLNHLDCEIFPQSLGYTSFRRDRCSETKGGGVFILVRNTFVATEQKELQTDCEILWVKLELEGYKSLYIASYYRNQEGDSHSFEELRKSLEHVSQLKGDVWVLGDLNFPDISWSEEHVPSVKPGYSFPKLYEDFINTLDDCNLEQMVSKPTRGKNTLDLFLTSNYTLVNNVDVKPGISDHDLVFSGVFTKRIETGQPPRSAYLYRKADWGGFQTYMEKVKEEILASTNSKSVEELWILFKSSINEGLSKFVPCKKIGSKRSLPWITQEIKRLIRKRDSLYQMYKRSSRPKYRKQFVTTRHIVKAKIKQAYNSYLEDLLGVNNPDQNISPAGETGLSKFAPKKLFSFLKNSRQESQGIGPLRDPHTNEVLTSNTDKANLIKDLLQSVFTPVSPLGLNQLSESDILEGLAKGILKEDNIPGTFRPKVPEMPQIEISLAGILKLLAGLDPSKAAGSDAIKAIVLRSLKDQVAPILQAIFQHSLNTGRIPDWKKAIVTPLFKKGDKCDHGNYRPISLTCICCKLMEHIIASNLTKRYK